MVKLIVIGHPHLPPKYACGNHLFVLSSPGEGNIFVTYQMVTKMMPDYFQSFIQSAGT